MIIEMVLVVIGIVASLVASIASSIAKSSEKQKYCLIASLAALTYFSITFINFYNHDVDIFLIVQRLTLIAGLYMLLGFAFAISYIFKVNFSNYVKLIIVGISLLFVLLFTTFSDNSPWIKGVTFILDDRTNLWSYKVDGDWLYYVLNSIVLLLFVTWIVIILLMTKSQKGREFKIFRYALALAMIPLFIWIFAVFKVLKSSICNEIVFMILLLAVMHVEIFFEFMPNTNTYSESLIENSNKGLIILDFKKRFVYANKTAKEYFDIIAKDNKDAITAFINVNLLDEVSYFDGNETYDLYFEMIPNSPLKDGYALWIEKK